MARTKYMMSGGLAFSEAKDMEKLRVKSSQGWHVKKFRFMGYELEQGEKEEVVYSIDYRLLQENEEDEYRDLFTDAGWTHVCSEYDMHLFKAKPGTVPIYSESESMKVKYDQLQRTVSVCAIILLIVSCLLWIVATFTSGTAQHIGNIGFLGSLVFTIPALMTLMATYYQKWKVRR